MELEKVFSFQTDSQIVNDHLKNHENYLIEFNQNVSKDYCIVYFSSNDLYYPNNEKAFKENIIDKNRFEWYGNRIEIGHKHIFIRDIQKQWYLGGINFKINTPQKLFEFLERETKGYKTYFIGSSAGGFASVIFGQLLNAERIMTFNGQFEILSILERSNEKTDPLIFRNRYNEDLIDFYDSRKFIKNEESIFYFHSLKSSWDVEQNKLVSHFKMNSLKFKSNNHGLPFYRFNLSSVFKFTLAELLFYSKKNNIQPFYFSIQLMGWKNTVFNLWKLYFNYSVKLLKRKI